MFSQCSWLSAGTPSGLGACTCTPTHTHLRFLLDLRDGNRVASPSLRFAALLLEMTQTGFTASSLAAPFVFKPISSAAKYLQLAQQLICFLFYFFCQGLNDFLVFAFFMRSIDLYVTAAPTLTSKQLSGEAHSHTQTHTHTCARTCSSVRHISACEVRKKVVRSGLI